MRYVVEYRLLDGTRMQCILSGNNKNEVKNKSLSIFRVLYSRCIVRGNKYAVTEEDIINVEKWNTNHRAVSNGGSRIFSVILVDRGGNNYTSTKCRAQGYKTAYNSLTDGGQDGSNYIIFLYDNSQRVTYKSSTSEARRLLSNKTRTMTVLNKACEKSKKIVKTTDISVLDDIPLLCNMVYDYCKGLYKRVPVRTVIGATAAIIYFVSPFDLIPDFIPFIGQVDDIAVMSYVLKCLHNDLMEYKAYSEHTVSTQTPTKSPTKSPTQSPTPAMNKNTNNISKNSNK